MRFGLKEEIVRAIIDELQKRGNIKKAVMFGSRARGDYRYNSDIDIALYLEGKMAADLYLDMDEAAGIYKIDLIDMKDIGNDALKENIEQQGIEIYANSNAQF